MKGLVCGVRVKAHPWVGTEGSLNSTHPTAPGRGSHLGVDTQASVLQDGTAESTPMSVQETKVNALHPPGVDRAALKSEDEP